MSESATKAVFLSYASQDAEAAKRICEALRADSIEVWFDQSELVGGDAWDAKIRKQLQECALFIPMVSANTQARSEGYFRIEWRLAAQRTYAMADDTTFLMPVVIDETRDADARVPAEFKAVQWTRLPRGETTPAFCERVIALLSGQGETGRPRLRRADATAWSTTAAPASAKRNNPPWLTALMVGVPLFVGLFFAWRVLPGKASPPPSSASVGTQPLAAEKPAAVFPRDPELKHAWNLFLNAPNNTTEDFALAEDIVKAAATSHPTDPETVIVYAWLNDTYINRGFDLSEERYMLGRRYAERAVLLAPEDPEALAAFGQFLSFRDADLGRAEQLLRHAIELNPHEPRFYRALAYNVLREQQPAEALQLEERAEELFPQDPLVHYEVGLLYRDAGRLDDMEHAFDRCLTLAPIGAAMIWKAWIAAWVHGDLASMKQWIDQLPDAVRLNDRALVVRYEFACMSRDPAELADSLRALKAFPGSTLRDFWYTGPKALLLGDLYATQGQPELAKGQYELALAEVVRQKTATPADLNVSIAETSALVGLGRREEALAAMRVRVSLTLAQGSPRWVIWWFGMVPTYLLLGDKADALQLLKQYTATAALRNQVRAALRIDPRMTVWHDDPEISALVAEPAEKNGADHVKGR